MYREKKCTGLELSSVSALVQLTYMTKGEDGFFGVYDDVVYAVRLCSSGEVTQMCAAR